MLLAATTIVVAANDATVFTPAVVTHFPFNFVINDVCMGTFSNYIPLEMRVTEIGFYTNTNTRTYENAKWKKKMYKNFTI